MTGPRPSEVVRQELETALSYRARYQARPVSTVLAQEMRAANELEIEELQQELMLATAGELEMRLTGPAFDDHRIGVPLLSRLLESLQSSFRAMYRSITPHEHVRRGEATLSLLATTPGSFRIVLNTPPSQLDLLEPPLPDRAMGEILMLLSAASRDEADQVATVWAERTDEPVVRSMIKLAAALAGSHSSTFVRWKSSSSDELVMTVGPAQARALAIALAGQSGREILTVTGHLEMGQDQPPRVRITTVDDEYLARVPTQELLDRVKELIFGEVQATLVVDMRTSPTTGTPGIEIELLDLTQV